MYLRIVVSNPALLTDHDTSKTHIGEQCCQLLHTVEHMY